MSVVSFNGEAIEHTNSLRYLGIHFDIVITYKTQVESTKLGCKKGLSALKAMASQGIEQRHLFLLCQSHWLWSGSHNPVTVQPAEAGQGAKLSHESPIGNNKGHTH